MSPAHAIDSVLPASHDVRVGRRPALRSAVLFHATRAEAADALYTHRPKRQHPPIVVALSAGAVPIGHTWALYTDGLLRWERPCDTTSLLGAPNVGRKPVVLVDDGELAASTLVQAALWLRRGGCTHLTLATVVADAALEERVGDLVDELVVAHRVERLHRGCGLYLEGEVSERRARELLATPAGLQSARKVSTASSTSRCRSR